VVGERIWLKQEERRIKTSCNRSPTTVRVEAINKRRLSKIKAEYETGNHIKGKRGESKKDYHSQERGLVSHRD